LILVAKGSTIATVVDAFVYISRGVLAVLVAIGMQLPCPCPSMAEAGSSPVSEQEAESCCPGGDKDDVSEKQMPGHDDGHVCSHCSDDHYTKAASVELVKVSDWLFDGSSPHTFAALPSSASRHLVEGGSEYRLDRPPPDIPLVVDSGRQLRILHSSLLC
jgi:hypothetical protein